MTSTVTDAEIGKYWDEMELEDRISLLGKCLFGHPKECAALYYNWVGLRKKTQARLRRGILADHHWNHHISPDSPSAVGGVQVREITEFPAERDPVQFGGRGRDSAPAGPGRTGKTPRRRVNYCSRCEIRFGSDGEDTLEFSKTGECERCAKDQMAGKVRSDRTGEEVFQRVAVTEFYLDRQDNWKPKVKRLGLTRKTKWE